MNYKKLALKISYLSATDNFKMINFNIKNTKEGKTLFLEVKENKQNASLRLGLHYDFVYKSGVLINLNKKNILSKNDAISLDFVVGDKPRFDLQYISE